MTRLLAERETLLVEVNHRAKNSLTIASSILGVQAGRHADAAVKSALLHAQQRLVAMARVHDLLSRTEELQRVPLSQYLRELSHGVSTASEAGDRVTLAFDIDESIGLNPAIAVPVGVVVVELLLNAFKYAFPGNRAGRIAVEARRAGGGRIALTVQDDGIGISGSEQHSIGTGMMQALMLQLGSHITIHGEGGVRADISFPDNESAG